MHFASAGAHGLEHFAHLLVLAEEVVDLLDGGAGAEGDALAAAAVDDGRVAALLGGHRVDDGFNAAELLLVDRAGGLLHLGEGAYAGGIFMMDCMLPKRTAQVKHTLGDNFWENDAVTMCAGFKSTYGVVLCADSQETVGVMKFAAPKLVILPSIGNADDQVRMVFAGAGNGPFIDKLVEKMWEAALRGPGMTSADVFDRVEDANIEWHRRIPPLPLKLSPLP